MDGPMQAELVERTRELLAEQHALSVCARCLTSDFNGICALGLDICTWRNDLPVDRGPIQIDLTREDRPA